MRHAAFLSTVAVTLFLSLLPGALAATQYKYKILHAFGSGTDGAGVWGGLAFDVNGNLYGTTGAGGAHGDGTVFELTPQADGTWTESVLHSFPAFPDDGGGPFSTPALDAAGSLYATTVGGGAHHGGTIFELAHDTWAETVLYNFCSKPHCSDGGAPDAGLARDHEGNFYGTAGNPFRLSANPGGWKLTVLHRFPAGFCPCGGVTLDSAGNVYGVTTGGGTGNACAPPGCGIAYELQPMPDGKWKEIVLHNFGSFGIDGRRPPFEALILDSSGNVCGKRPFCTASPSVRADLHRAPALLWTKLEISTE